MDRLVVDGLTHRVSAPVINIIDVGDDDGDGDDVEKAMND